MADTGQQTQQDIIQCKGCGHITAILDDKTCANCGREVCRSCGCTDDHACQCGCYWSKPGLCSACAEYQVSVDGVGDVS